MPDDLETEVVQPAEGSQVRANEGSVRHVEVFRMGGVGTSIIGRPRPSPAQRRAGQRPVPRTPATPSTVKSPFSAAGRVGSTLFTLNARCDSSGREDLAAVLGERRPDVVVIQGAARRLREHLDESGLLDGHPYRAFFPMDQLPSCGTAIYSTVPVGETAASTADQPAVRVQLEDGPVVLVPADGPGPQYGLAAWESNLAGMGKVAAAHVRDGEAVIVAGDFNAVREHLPFRRLLDGGLVNAAELARTRVAAHLPGRPSALAAAHRDRPRARVPGGRGGRSGNRARGWARAPRADRVGAGGVGVAAAEIASGVGSPVLHRARSKSRAPCVTDQGVRGCPDSPGSD